MTPREVLAHHVTGAIARGQAEPIIEQPALPEAAHVRDIENKTPTFDSPFALTAPANSGADAVQRDLFRG